MSEPACAEAQHLEGSGSMKKDAAREINPWVVHTTRSSHGYSVVIRFDAQDGSQSREIDISPVYDGSYSNAQKLRTWLEKFFDKEPRVRVGPGTILRMELKAQRANKVRAEGLLAEAQKRVAWLEGELRGKKKGKR